MQRVNNLHVPGVKSGSHSVKTQVGVETLKIKDTVRHHLPATYSKASLNNKQRICT